MTSVSKERYQLLRTWEDGSVSKSSAPSHVLSVDMVESCTNSEVAACVGTFDHNQVLQHPIMQMSRGFHWIRVQRRDKSPELQISSSEYSPSVSRKPVIQGLGVKNLVLPIECTTN